jgi:hypothetical protein
LFHPVQEVTGFCFADHQYFPGRKNYRPPGKQKHRYPKLKKDSLNWLKSNRISPGKEDKIAVRIKRSRLSLYCTAGSFCKTAFIFPQVPPFDFDAVILGDKAAKMEIGIDSCNGAARLLKHDK